MPDIIHRWRPYADRAYARGTRITSPLAVRPSKRPASQAVRSFLDAHWNSDLFTVEADGENGFMVHILASGTAIPFSDLAFRPEIGLYRQSDSPKLPSFP